jgi:hypothetical protein
MYYRLDHADLYDEEDNECTYFFIDNLDEEDLEWPWLHGVEFRNPPSFPISMQVDLSDEAAADFCDYAMSAIPMVTERFKAVLDACGVSNIQYFPVTIAGADRFEDCPTHYAVNIIGLVSVADEDKSVYQKAFNQMGAHIFDKCVVKENIPEGLKIFRMAESVSQIIISEEIMIACEKAGVDTFHYWPLE